MGGPRVFLGHLCLFPRKTLPECSGMGNYSHGHRDQLGFCVLEGILGYGYLSHVGIAL